MASCEISCEVVPQDGEEIPRWKKELKADLNAYARTLTTASGSVKLTVTCPKSLRPKKQISKVKEPSVNVNTETVINKEEESNKTEKSKENVQVIKERLTQNRINLSPSADEISKYYIVEEDNNLPKPGLVQTLKIKYLSLIKERNKGNARRSSSAECVTENCKNPFLQDARKKSYSVSYLEKINSDYVVPAISTVENTKKIFEPNGMKTTKVSSTNPFLQPYDKKPNIMAKPIVKPKRINKPPLSPKSPQLTTEKFFKKTPIVKSFVNSPTSPVKSSRDLS